MLDARDERVERQRLSGERGTVAAETLRRRPGHRDAQRLMARELLGPGGGVDHHALAGPGGPDEDRAALGAGDDLQRMRLLVAQAPADPLGDLVARDLASDLPNVAAGRLGELGEPAARSPARGRAPPASSSTHPPAGGPGARRSSPVRTRAPPWARARRRTARAAPPGTRLARTSRRARSGAPDAI